MDDRTLEYIYTSQLVLKTKIIVYISSKIKVVFFLTVNYATYSSQVIDYHVVLKKIKLNEIRLISE